MNKGILIIILIGCALAITMSCSNRSKGENYRSIGPKEFEQEVSNDYIQLFDVRTPAEYAQGHIKGAQNLDIKDTAGFDKGMDKMDKNRPVYIYCRSGHRSQEAARRLKERGFEVIELAGGINRWMNEHYPVVE